MSAQSCIVSAALGYPSTGRAEAWKGTQVGPSGCPGPSMEPQKVKGQSEQGRGWKTVGQLFICSRRRALPSPGARECSGESAPGLVPWQPATLKLRRATCVHKTLRPN